MKNPDGNWYDRLEQVIMESDIKILSVNIGKSRTIEFNGKMEETGIYKEPTTLPVMIHKMGLEGDTIIDKKVHGGINKAVYIYFQSHYDYWINEIDRDDMTPGMFGENLTVTGTDESGICGGDRIRAGEALLEAVALRTPCYKLNLKINEKGFIKKFILSERFGIYFRVIEEGLVKAGDLFSVEYQHPARLKFSDIISMYIQYEPDSEKLRIALSVEALDAGLRDRLAKKLYN